MVYARNRKYHCRNNSEARAPGRPDGCPYSSAKIH